LCGTTKRPHFAKGFCNRCYSTRPGEGKPCKCGCGQITSTNRGKPQDFIHGHWLKSEEGYDHMLPYILNNSQGDGNPCYGKFGTNHPAFGHLTTDKCRNERRERMLKRISQHKNAPTDIEIILSKMLDDLHILHKSQHIIGNKFAVDEFVPSCRLLIEAYGDYWHGNPLRWNNDNMYELQKKNIKKDYSRRKYFEACGYSLLILWETDLKKNPEKCIKLLQEHLVPIG
jgi:very-short-patch-repair endonuclease